HLKLARKAGEPFIGPSRSKERHAHRNAAGYHPTRNRDRAEIEEISEVGIMAKLIVEQHRISCHLGDRTQPRRCRHHQRVDRYELLSYPPAQLRKTMHPGKRSARRILAAGLQDRASYLEQVISMPIDERCERRMPLGDPRTVEQHLTRFPEGCKVNLD